MKRRFILLIVIALSLLETGSVDVAAENSVERIRFNVIVISESEKGDVLSNTRIDGPAGTDFNINLKTKGFEMTSRFLTDLLANGELLVRVRLATRRYYGESSNGLPLYEEDKQTESFRVGLNESVVLLPYGRNGGGETLKIEITPELYHVSRADKNAERLKIDFPKQLSGGEIAIEASKVPHRYLVEAALFANGHEVARGSAENLLEEQKEITLVPNESATDLVRAGKFTVRFTVDRYIRSRPFDLTAISFEVADDSIGTVATGKGINGLGRDFKYELGKELGTGYEVRFRVVEQKEKK